MIKGIDALTAIQVGLPWLLSASTIWGAVLAGNKDPRTWVVGLVNQFFWMVWSVSMQSWGLMPLNVWMTWICYQNHKKWKAAA